MIARASDQAAGSPARPQGGSHAPPQPKLAGRCPDASLEPYRLLLSRLPALRTLGLTSAAAGEGVSTVTARVACAAAALPGRVLLVDAHLERPAQHRHFDLEPGPGLAEVLLDGTAPGDVIQWPGVADLAVLTAGTPGNRLPAAREALAQGQALDAIKAGFDLVLFDLPPGEDGPLAARLGALLDGVLLVIEAEATAARLVQREKALLTRANVPLLGAVLNKRRQYIPGWLQRCL